MWNEGAFALIPISVTKDRKTLTVQFFWQIKQPEIMTEVDLTTVPLSTRNLESSGNSFLYHGSIGLLKSSQLLEINTDDPVRRPLPSMALL